MRHRLPLLLAAAAIIVVLAVSSWRYLRSPAPGAVAEATQPMHVERGAPAYQRGPSARRAGGDLPTGVVATPQQAQASIARRRAMQEQLGREADAARAAAAAAFAGERVDSQWARSKQAELEAIASAPAIAASGASPISFEAQCRRTLCKLDAQFATSAQADDWSLVFTTSLGNAMPSSTVTRTPVADGSTQIEIYGKAR